MSGNWQVGASPGASGDFTTRSAGQSEKAGATWTKGEHTLSNGRGVTPPAGPTAEKTNTIAKGSSLQGAATPASTIPSASSNIPKPQTAKKTSGVFAWFMKLIGNLRSKQATTASPTPKATPSAKTEKPSVAAAPKNVGPQQHAVNSEAVGRFVELAKNLKTLSNEEKNTILTEFDKENAKTKAEIVAKIDDTETQIEFLSQVNGHDSTEVCNSVIDKLDSKEAAALVEVAMKKEIDKALVATFLRENNLGTKLLAAINFKLVNPVFEKELTAVLNQLPRGSVALDVSRGATEEEVERSIDAVNKSTQYTLETLVSMTGSKQFPETLKNVYKQIHQDILDRKNDEGKRLFDETFATDKVGNLFMLRYFSAIVATSTSIPSPTSTGPMLKGYQKPADLSRGPIVVGKYIQNLANNVPYGGKEAAMLPFNEGFSEKRALIEKATQNLLS